VSLGVGVLLLLAGCGDSDTNSDDSADRQPSSDRVRAVVLQFQDAAARGDDEAGCELMDESLRTSVVLHGVPPDNPQARCSIAAALGYPDSTASFPGAHIVYVHVDPHDSAADVQFGNGTRLKLTRETDQAPWRIDTTGFRPAPSDWTR
jgi:hypothetical protein